MTDAVCESCGREIYRAKCSVNEPTVAIANIRYALAKWEVGYKLDLSGSDVEDLLEAYDQIKEVLK